MEGKSEKFGFIMFLLLLAFFFGGFGAGYALWHNDNNVSLAPVYALDCIVDTSKVGATSVCYPAGELSVFWNDVTKSTQFTVNGKPVGITDIQVFYEQPCGYLSNNNYGIPTFHDCSVYGNITYYPLGIYDSQTYVAPAPTSTPSSCTFLMCMDHLGDCQLISGPCDFSDDYWKIPNPTPTPSNVDISMEWNGYSSQDGNWTVK